MPPKPIDMSGRKPTAGSTGDSAPRTLVVGAPKAAPPPPAAPQEAIQTPHKARTGPPSALGLGGRPGASGDALEARVQKIVAADPALEKLRHRIRPRLQELLAATEQELLNWGARNLATLQEVSKGQAEASERLSQINLEKWTRECREATTRPPSWTDKFVERPGPAFYEQRLRVVQAELQTILGALGDMHRDISEEPEDLRLDVACLSNISDKFTDPTTLMMVNNRIRTLTTGQQAAAQIMGTIDAQRQMVIKGFDTVDQLLNVTLPAWISAYKT